MGFRGWTSMGWRVWIRVVATSALLLICSVGKAAEAEASFDAAARLYEQGKYREAARAYEQLASQDSATVAVLFNQGNAWLKAGEKGRAIACYRKAQQLAPRDPEISSNLELARSRVGSAGSPRLNPVDRFLGILTPNEWAIVAIAAVWGWFVLMMIREFAPKLLVLGPLGCWIVAAGAAAVMALAYAANVREQRPYAVVSVSEATVRFGPLEEAQAAFTLSDGAELLVTDRKGAWLEVRDGSGRRGWVASRNLVKIP
ncbi:MAG: tetratricopeptide repeat protein [Limisphaerales bacterium]